VPAESPGTSLICMSICPNKNIWFEAKPAPATRINPNSKLRKGTWFRYCR